ncbi:MAG: hypothetical protein HUJ94_01975, partial [Bacteroidales bacterium]|nr:hypothetical protein [Bacteroidales bacterium]
VVWHLGGASLAPDSPFKLKLNFRNNMLMLGRNIPYTEAVVQLYTLLLTLEQRTEVLGTDRFTNCLSIFETLSKEERVTMLKLAASCGVFRGRTIILLRRILNLCSAAVYVFTGHFSYAGAVFKAHSEFRKMRKKVSKDELVAYLGLMMLDTAQPHARTLLELDTEKCLYGAPEAGVRGMYDGWIVMDSFRHRDGVFKVLKDALCL